MFPPHNFQESTIACIKAFVKGDMSIADFMDQYARSGEIASFLDWVVDTMETEHIPIKRRTVCMKNVNQNKPFQPCTYVEIFIKEYAQLSHSLSDSWKEAPPKISRYLEKCTPLTAMGALYIHSIVADAYYQIDPEFPRTEKYMEAFEFCLDVLPGYLAGGVSAEDYISRHILTKYPETMKKGERKRLVKAEINQAFLRDGKGYPRWLQSPEWPMAKNGKPMIYTGQKAFEDYTEFYFRDGETNENDTVTQWW